MFGYVRPYKPQLLVWENELFGSIYCGLCKHGGKRTTRLSRFLLNYDFVSLAIARMMLTGDEIKTELKFCPYFPKKKVMLQHNKSLDFTSDAFIILTYYKFLDDKKDSKGIKHFFYSFSPLMLHHEAKKAEKRNTELSKEIKNELSRLAKMETENSVCLDSVADCFAVLLGKILSFDLPENEKRIAYQIGYHIGRYVYIIDALDDFKDDFEKNNFNPLVNLYGDEKSLINDVESIISTLKCSMKEVLFAMELLPESNLKGIFRNIISHGADNVINQIIEKFKK